MTGKSIRMAKPVRIRIDASLRQGIEQHATTLSAASGRQISISAALRDLLRHALDSGPDASRASAWAEAFLAAYAESKRELMERLHGSNARSRSTGGHER